MLFTFFIIIHLALPIGYPVGAIISSYTLCFRSDLCGNEPWEHADRLDLLEISEQVGESLCLCATNNTRTPDDLCNDKTNVTIFKLN